MSHRLKVYSILVVMISFFTFIFPVNGKSNLTEPFNNLFLIVSLISLAVLVLVLVLFVYFNLKYRETNEEVEREPLPHSTGRKLEFAWTIVATLIVILLMIASYPVLVNVIDNNDENVLNITGEEPKEVIVEGTGNWEWRFHYNGTIYEPVEDAEGVSTTTIALKTDTPYRFILWSSGQWIHSFFIRDLGFKQDVVPGTNNTFSIVIEEPGTYEILCAEYCGPGHSQMRGFLIAED